MAKIFNIKNFDERKQFEIKLQIALLNNTLKIKANSKNPEKYDEYIQERIEKMREILDTTAKFKVMDGDKTLYSSEVIGEL
ncbi:hypothetical protein [Ferroplasma sp.]|uniref:hypothetical protein n=1 Tax=Ferroplasma sp. TaxID=2591003 RepID=UPI00307F9B84